MPDHENYSIAERAKGSPGAHYQLDDNIELPQGPDSMNRFDTFSGGTSSNLNAPSRAGKMFGIVFLAAAMGIGGWFAIKGGSAEQKYESWKHVAAATDASGSDISVLTHVDGSGAAEEVQTIQVSREDRDFVTTSAVKQALFSNDLQAATVALQNAQQLPASQDPDVKRPEIKPGSQLESEIRRNQQEFFNVHVFDCCDEDGDVVDILINGRTFATVPLTHKGTTLSIPLQPGNNTLTLRGVKDGKGGITVSFATSRGNYYCRAMRVGQEHTMGVVAR